MSGYNVVSLFSGCGGMDLGFRGGFDFLGRSYPRHGFNIVFSNDIEKKACATYEHNFKQVPFCGDIGDIKVSDIPDCDVIIGGFPCQDFSLAGKRRGLASTRGILYRQMLRIVQGKRPYVFVAENVEGISISIKSQNPLEKIIQEFRNSGYKVDYRLFNTADFGVPQVRKRVIIVGVREDLGVSSHFPKQILHEKSWISSKLAIDDLWDKLDTGYVKNHTQNDFSKAKMMDKGQGNRKIEADKPSITIRAEHHGNIEAHYRSLEDSDPNDRSKWRRLTVRECARLQSFPDDFEFPCAASSAYRQIGNAVPPVFAWCVAESVRQILEEIVEIDSSIALTA